MPSRYWLNATPAALTVTRLKQERADGRKRQRSFLGGSSLSYPAAGADTRCWAWPDGGQRRRRWEDAHDNRWSTLGRALPV